MFFSFLLYCVWESKKREKGDTNHTCFGSAMADEDDGRTVHFWLELGVRSVHSTSSFLLGEAGFTSFFA